MENIFHSRFYKEKRRRSKWKVEGRLTIEKAVVWNEDPLRNELWIDLEWVQ